MKIIEFILMRIAGCDLQDVADGLLVSGVGMYLVHLTNFSHLMDEFSLSVCYFLSDLCPLTSVL